MTTLGFDAGSGLDAGAVTSRIALALAVALLGSAGCRDDEDGDGGSRLAQKRNSAVAESTSGDRSNTSPFAL